MNSFKKITLQVMRKLERTNPQCTFMVSFISKEASLSSRGGYPPKSEPPSGSLGNIFSLCAYVRVRSTGDSDGEVGILAIACSTGI